VHAGHRAAQAAPVAEVDVDVHDARGARAQARGRVGERTHLLGDADQGTPAEASGWELPAAPLLLHGVGERRAVQDVPQDPLPHGPAAEPVELDGQRVVERFLLPGPADVEALDEEPARGRAVEREQVVEGDDAVVRPCLRRRRERCQRCGQERSRWGAGAGRGARPGQGRSVERERGAGHERPRLDGAPVEGLQRVADGHRP
jgi:hypothetical protein